MDKYSESSKNEFKRQKFKKKHLLKIKIYNMLGIFRIFGVSNKIL